MGDWKEVHARVPAEEHAELLSTQSARCMNCGTPYCLNKATGEVARAAVQMAGAGALGCVRPAASPGCVSATRLALSAPAPSQLRVLHSPAPWPAPPPRLPPGQPHPRVERAGAPGSVGGGAAPAAGDQQLPRVHGWVGGWGGARGAADTVAPCAPALVRPGIVQRPAMRRRRHRSVCLPAGCSRCPCGGVGGLGAGGAMLWLTGPA